MSGSAHIDETNRLGEALAQELLLASRMLGDLAYGLGSDEDVLRRHLTSLQTIDHVTQMLLIVADLIGSKETDGDRLMGISLEDMRKRLLRANERIQSEAEGTTACL